MSPGTRPKTLTLTRYRVLPLTLTLAPALTRYRVLPLTLTLTLTLTRYRVLPRGTSLHMHGGRIVALHLLLRGEVALYSPTPPDPDADAPCWRLPARQGIGGEKLSPTGKGSPTHGAGAQL